MVASRISISILPLNYDLMMCLPGSGINFAQIAHEGASFVKK